MTIVVLTIVNCLDVRAGSRLQSVLMVLKIGAIAALVLAGMFLIRSPYPLQHPVLDGLHPSISSHRSAQPWFLSCSPSEDGRLRTSLPQKSRPAAQSVSRDGGGGGWRDRALHRGELRMRLSTRGRKLGGKRVPASSVMRMAMESPGARLIAMGIAISTLVS